MTVSGSHSASYAFSPHPRSSSTPVSRPDDTKRDRQEFRSILANDLPTEKPDHLAAREAKGLLSMERAFVALNEGIDLGSSTRAYTLKVSVGENAVAFQARPIIGPVAIDTDLQAPNLQLSEVSGHPLVLPPEAVTRGQPHALSVRSQANSLPDIPRLDRSSRIPAPTSITARPALAHSAVSTADLKSSISSIAASPPKQNLSQQIRATPMPPAQESAHRPSPSQNLAAQAKLFAQLIATATEYRVAIRGAQLTAEDRERLVAEIHAALRSYGLADRPISLIAISGNT